MKSIIQAEATECGLAALAIVSAIRGARYTLAELRARFPPPSRGQTLSQVMDVAAALGLKARAVRCDLVELEHLTLPAILHWDLNHFVVLTQIKSRGLVIEDPAVGRTFVKMDEASQHFSGVALELTTTEKFAKRRSRPPLSAAALITWTRPVVIGLVQALLLSVVMQIYVLAAPFYMQLAIDEAALKGDLSLLNVLAIGFGLFAVFNVIASLLRGIASQRVTALLGWGMTSRLYNHLLKLPLRWFQRRRLADTLIRFESIEPIRQVVANGLVTSLIDGIFAVSIVVILFISSWKLAFIALIATTLHVVLKWVSVPTSIRFASAELTAQISEQGKRIETLTAIQTIKALAAESERERDWSSQYSQVIRAEQKNGLFQLWLRSSQDLLEAVTYAALVYVAVTSVIASDMTIGGAFAFIAYRQQFHERASALFDMIISWRMLDLHTDRLSEIVLEAPEPQLGQLSVADAMVGSLQVSGLGFRYSPTEPMIFQSLSLDIKAGEFVAFVGASGQGKTTLMKVLAGLYPASAGEIRIDGRPLSAWGMHRVRRSIGMVLQDDQLLSGTIAENVAFFEEQPDLAWALECLKSAAVADEIAEMPMGIETFVGDMGSALSGGQKQRILLARALYRRPSILILDEATSHLDQGNEQKITAALESLAITRLIVAHRRETIAKADVLVSMRGTSTQVLRRTAALADGEASGQAATTTGR